MAMTEAQQKYYQAFGMLPREAYDNIVSTPAHKRGKRAELKEVKAFMASLRKEKKEKPKG